MTGFYGQFEYQMDEKGRVALPSAFRRETASDRFVLLQWEKAYLTLFPDSVWADKQESLLELRRSGAEASRFVRQLLSMAAEVVPDRQGRILVPSWLQEAVSLEGKVLFIGNIDHVELWSPDRYQEDQAPDFPDDVAGFAQRILG